MLAGPRLTRSGKCRWCTGSIGTLGISAWQCAQVSALRLWWFVE